MGLFNFFSKKEARPAKPYRQDAFNSIYEMLFCDNVGLYRSAFMGSDYPANVLFAGCPK